MAQEGYLVLELECLIEDDRTQTATVSRKNL